MTKQEKLENLFTKWRKKQAAEKDYDIADIDIDSFSPDGPISPEDYFSCKTRILFISKESNLKNGRKFQNDYWLQKVYTKEYPETNFSKGIALLTNALINNNFSTPSKNHNGLKYISFMNLNKRGGRSRCNKKNLEKYIETYHAEIAKEIDILEPTVIICAGKWLKWYLEKYIKTENKYKIIEVYHPSYHYKSDIEHLKKLKDELDKIN